VASNQLIQRAGSVRVKQSKPGALNVAWKDPKAVTRFVTVMMWLLVFIMITPQGFDYEGKGGMPTSSDLLSKVIWMILLFGSLAIVGARISRAKKLLAEMNPFLLLFLGLAFASYLWSIEPAISFRRALRAFTIMAACFSFALVGWNRYRYEDVLRTILTTITVLSIVFVIVAPDMAVHRTAQAETNNAWHGVTIGKNVLGSLASGSLLLWLNGYMSRAIRPAKALLGAAPAALCLVMTRSATSIMATVFTLLFMMILLRSPGTLKRYMPYLVALFATVILIYVFAMLRLVPGSEILLQPITMLTGKDLTFTGRTSIWEILNQNIHAHPWLGTGYGAYWIGATPNSPSYEMLLKLYYYPSEGHNGYLDVLNDLGRVGMACLIAYFVSYIKQGLQLMKLDRYKGGLFLAVLFRGFLADMSESHWFSALAIDFALMTLATMSLGRALYEARLNHARELSRATS